ncbi:MAG TPA: alpha/beta hydrolase, partial [Actinomycetota bacterium]
MPEHDDGFVDPADGGRLHYEVAGTGPAVTLLHPGLWDMRAWDPQFEPWAERFRVLRYDMRGYGASSRPDGSAYSHVRDLEAVLDEEGIDRFHLMTFSRGTSWGLQLALAHRGRVASLSIGDYRAAEVALTREMVEAQLATWFRGKPVSERVPAHVLVELGRESKARDLWDDLASLSCPLLVARPGAAGILDDEQVDRYRA